MSFFVISAQNKVVQKDSTNIEIVQTTPFTKGRWLVGMTGSIGSANTRVTSTNEKTSSNRYNIAMGAGNFIIDRLNIGLLVGLERQNTQNASEEGSTIDNLFVGPRATYYISKSEIGSLYFGLTPGFVRYWNETVITQDDILVNNINKGNGFGLVTTFGYTYVIYDRIGLDIGLNWSSNWIDINQESTNSNAIEHVNFVISDLTFSFGFKILLDKQTN